MVNPAMLPGVDDFRDRARRRLPRFLFDYIDGGACQEVTLDANRRDLDAIALRQRILRDVAGADLSCELFGTRHAMPVGLAPIGLAGLSARRGETQAVRAANAANIPFCLSTVSACSLGEVAAAAEAPFWFQLYMMRDRGFMTDLLAQAREADCPVLVFTVDMPVPGKRYRDYRSGLAGASGVAGQMRRMMQAIGRPGWAVDVGLLGRPHSLGNVAPLLGASSGLEDFMAWMSANFEPSVGWSDIDWLRRHWDGPIVVKGILDAEDARTAVSAGVEGIVVSNHGGRQLDGVHSTATALPAIADAAWGALTILADGGVRSGLDVARLLALGADGVLLGRAWAYALGAAGEAGVSRVIAIIEEELRIALALMGEVSATAIGLHNLAGRADVLDKAVRLDP